MIIVCGGTKGGSGKTTVCTNLAVMRAIDGRDVLLVDADEQGSSTLFSTQRRQDYGDKAGYTSIVLSEERVRTEVLAMRHKFDDILIDTGGRDSKSQRAAISIADLLVIPFKPSSLDIWTLENNQKVIDDMRPYNPSLRVVAFVNQADAQGNDNADAGAVLAEIEWLQFLETPVVYRRAIRRATSWGLAVCESKPADRKAIDEVNALYNVVFGINSTP